MYMFAMNEMPLPGFASRTMPISASTVASVYQASVRIGSKSSTSALYPPKFPMAVSWFFLISSQRLDMRADRVNGADGCTFSSSKSFSLSGSSSSFFGSENH